MTLGEALHELGRILELYKGTVYPTHPGARGPTTTVRVEALALLYGAYRDLEPRMRAAEISEAGAQRREADAREELAQYKLEVALAMEAIELRPVEVEPSTRCDCCGHSSDFHYGFLCQMPDCSCREFVGKFRVSRRQP